MRVALNFIHAITIWANSNTDAMCIVQNIGLLLTAGKVGGMEKVICNV